MTNSPDKSTLPSKPTPSAGHYLAHRRHRWLVFGLLGVAPLGFLDSSYLSIEHFLNRVPPCSITHGCEAVTTSQYAMLFGIPLALFGVAYYLAIILGLVYYLDSRRPAVLKVVAAATAAGFLFSAYLVYLQLAVIHAICQYCMLSAMSSTLLFVLGVFVLKTHRTFERQPAS